MRIIDAKTLQDTVRRLFMEACICPPADLIAALENARETESTPQGRDVLSQLLENAQVARDQSLPYCQDTGMAVIFLEVGQDVHIEGDLEAALQEGVASAYIDGYLRKSVVGALDRKNTGNNTPAIVHTRIVPGDKVKVIAAPKGFGSENMSQIRMLKPSQGIEGIKSFLIDTARQAAANPCPPVILGVGIGGTFEHAALCAKKELLRPLGQSHPDPEIARLEEEVKAGINALKMGPMGLGGDHYCLAVHIHVHPTHLAGLPVAVNYCCHALRHAEAVI